VLAGSAVGMLFGGWLADRIQKRSSNLVKARRYLGVGCNLTAAGALFLAVRCDEPLAMAGLCCASFLAMHITMPSWWMLVIPQCGRHVGTLSGLMNGAGVIGAMASQWFVGAFSDIRATAGHVGRAQWDPLFDVYVGVLVLGAIGWWCYRFRPL
jgi:MFS family permease